ncbi:hypothetical protein ACT3HK_11785 [Thermolongibacillus altinsuensis]
MNKVQKVLTTILVVMWCTVFAAFACGIGWLIEVVFNVNVNYYVAGGIGAFIFVLIFLIGLNQYLTFKKFSEEIEKNW